MPENYYQFRNIMVEALCRDLLGPVDEHEVIEDLPSTRYAIGVLFPQASGTIPDEENHQEEQAEGEGEDPPVSLANVKFPSSMGLTFAVDTNISAEIDIRITAARYKPDDNAHNSPGEGKDSARLAGWVREPLTNTAPITVGLAGTISGRRPTGIDGLDLFVRVRRPDSQGVVAVTLVLINTLPTAKDAESRSANSFFQPRIVVSNVNKESAPFVERPRNKGSVDDADLEAYALLYRHAREFAVGHGCSVAWNVDNSHPSHAVSVETEFIPRYRLPLADSNPAIDISKLTMRHLSEATRGEACGDLEALVTSYREWINGRRSELDSDPEIRNHLKVAEENLAQCGEAASRMEKGIRLLRDNDVAWKAFTLMNRAMLSQRARSEWIKGGKKTDSPAEVTRHAWRPFQIAFILMCLPGIAEPGKENSGRDIADLLWFPTGGGKTEAYLGLIAFTIFNRRLTKRDGGGVTALMRYTLRLLTIQQFERAALLICACEVLRREDAAKLGIEPISIGMWLGQSATPNTIADVRTALNKLRTGRPVDTGNPVQLHSCPWCGGSLTHTNYWIRQDQSRLVVSCKQSGCVFKDEIPVHLVDEDVYRFRPTLIIATADKFASLPWLDKCRALFNKADGARAEQPPPELIIQDELHLISGPLGSLAGLYETAIDALASENGIRPKVIASTATIRRAGDQARGLFARRMMQFPPPALDARDSYFSVEAPPEEKGDRMYVGLMSPSTSHTTLLVRTYAALLQIVMEAEAPDEVKDQYWTLVGYFNSLRVLGGARMQVQDDVDDRLTLLATQHGTEKREIKNVIELTSRRTASEIPESLKQISSPYPGDAVDVILATNMISVGVDVDRLGLMAVMGQPQSTSEYIQSTSRVGRRHPGLVVTMYNSARSRDRSHYESFNTYHSALYRQVESTSVTPFSARARDRALHAVFVALARMTIPGLRANDSAGNVDSYADELEAVKRVIKDRVGEVDDSEAAATSAQLDEIVDTWVSRAQRGELVYMDFNDRNKALLTDALAQLTDDDNFGTLWSLRDVDQESKLFFVGEKVTG